MWINVCLNTSASAYIDQLGQLAPLEITGLSALHLIFGTRTEALTTGVQNPSLFDNSPIGRVMDRRPMLSVWQPAAKIMYRQNALSFEFSQPLSLQLSIFPGGAVSIRLKRDVWADQYENSQGNLIHLT